MGVNQGKREEGRKERESKRSRNRKEFVLCYRKVNPEIKLSSFFYPVLGHKNFVLTRVGGVIIFHKFIQVFYQISDTDIRI